MLDEGGRQKMVSLYMKVLNDRRLRLSTSDINSDVGRISVGFRSDVG